MEYIGSFKRDPREEINGYDEPIDEHLQDKPPFPHATVLDNFPDTKINPYEYMGLKRDATQADIKRAYKKGALRWHPDKHPEEHKSSAQKAFQRLTTAYAVLNDPTRRAHYDATGKVHDALHMSSDDPWRWQPFYQYCWNKMAEGDIEAFAAEYRESEEERQDLLMQYNIRKGNMTKIYEYVTLSNPIDDDARYRVWIKEAIANGEVKAYKNFINESEESINHRIEQAQEEADEAEELRHELEDRGQWFEPPSDEENMAVLAIAIQQKNRLNHENHLDQLMKKYLTQPKGKKGKHTKKVMEEPPDEAFELNRRKGIEAGLRRDANRRWKRNTTVLKRKAAEEAKDEPAGKKLKKNVHPVKRSIRLKKKTEEAEELDDRVRDDETSSSTDEESEFDYDDVDKEFEQELQGEPHRFETNDTGDEEAEEDAQENNAGTGKPTDTNAGAAGAAVNTRPSRTRRVIIESEDEDEDDNRIELGSQDSDDDAEEED